MELYFFDTDIVNMETDAIVLPANPYLKEGSGASEAIFKAAGRKKLTQACKQLGTRKTGTAVPTPAYDLDAKYIIHAIVPKWVDGNSSEYELLCSAYLSALKVADTLECNSIAFPLLASGNNGFDIDLAFNIAVESIRSFNGEYLNKAVLVLFGDYPTKIAEKYGYSVVPLPFDLKKEEKKKETAKKILDGMDVVGKFVMDKADKAFEFFKDEENRETIIAVVKLAINVVDALNPDDK